VIRLIPPATSHQRQEKPLRLSERCGVSTAENIVGSRVRSLAGGMELTIPNYASQNTSQGGPQSPSQGGAKERRRACVKPARTRGQAQEPGHAVGGRLRGRCRSAAAMDYRRDRGSVPPVRGRSPRAQGRLQHVNPFTCSSRWCSRRRRRIAGVNKATPRSVCRRRHAGKVGCPWRETGAGADQDHRPLRTKAKNVVELSKRIAQEHGGEVPRTREALDGTAGRRPQDRKCRAHVAFGEPTIAVDTHIFRVGNRTGIATGKTPLEVEMKLDRVVPAKYKRHAHHWLILHGRYVCLARRPLCEKCLIADPL